MAIQRLGFNQLFIIGWNVRSKKLIENLKKMNSNKKITLLDSTVSKNPLDEKKINFFHGNSMSDETLLQANIEIADKCVITSSPYKTEKDADAETIVTILSIKRLNPKAYCIAEILTEEHKSTALYAGADKIIDFSKLTSLLMISSLPTTTKNNNHSTES